MSPRRPGKGVKGVRAEGLSREVILSAALELARRSGLEGFSMRDLAAELGTTQMAAYHYVKSREELLVLLVDKILSDIPVPGPEHGSWDERARILAETSLAVLRPWTGIGPIIMRLRPPQAVDMVLRLVAVLREAGFTEREALLAARMLRAWVFGELTVRQYADDAHDGPSAGAVNERPAALEREIGERDVADFALDVLLDGLRARLRGGSGRGGRSAPM